ncbi:branched-chain amino acid ABC transporter ATP-binding protein [Intrasporangium chromatireducens Q5-1]|uniref:Branched-chain amino acid ABC transporter ATP-binding protein n=1 Tax=Intrasporangium chromatireducens Q5-1 TaxID=584657 RepID=W9GN77_9MICO|nr:ABC transporter ATP-binding protein [Intrasporangium chromatireducens]EWT06512.1 branched-chain amino acid ABC transporter ATP-binding protein [Intrasporangium chromatireducens Q5-1]
MDALAIEDVRKSFGGVQALQGITFSVAPQEIVGVIGPNGSGKSTLFNVLTGALKPDSGRVLLNGKDITRWPAYRIARSGLGRTFQIPALFENMTVLENLLTASVEHNWDGVHERASAVIELLELQRVAAEPARSLSGGQQRLLELGRVLMREPDLVLLDEVAAGVHPNLRKLMLDVIRAKREAGTTFLVIEHDMELTGEICDRIIVMDAGEVVAKGTFEEISSDAHVMEAYLGVSVE